MIIPLPCDFGEKIETKEGLQMLYGVNWFQWSDRLEFTYFFSDNNRWSTGTFSCEDDPTYELQYQVRNTLLQDGFLKEKGYPLKGRGYLYGLKFVDGQLYAELILTDKYLSHVNVQCDRDGEYLPGGGVLVPPSWDTEEKQRSILLKQYEKINTHCRNR